MLSHCSPSSAGRAHTDLNLALPCSAPQVSVCSHCHPPSPTSPGGFPTSCPPAQPPAHAHRVPVAAGMVSCLVPIALHPPPLHQGSSKAFLCMPFSPTCQKIRFIWCFFSLFAFNILMRFAHFCPYLLICFSRPVSQQYQVAAAGK